MQPKARESCMAYLCRLLTAGRSVLIVVVSVFACYVLFSCSWHVSGILCCNFHTSSRMYDEEAYYPFGHFVCSPLGAATMSSNAATLGAKKKKKEKNSWYKAKKRQ